jgi:PIN domain nuclease of toxin-antitoxin system
MVLLDTHALLWWTLDPDKLSKKASMYCSKIVNEGCIISSISIWEIGIKIKNGGLDIGMSIDEYLQKINELQCVEIIPINEKIWIESIKLNWTNKDPADRVIVATALFRMTSIISKDEKIRKFFKKTIW